MSLAEFDSDMFDGSFDWLSLIPNDRLQVAADPPPNSISPSSQGTKRRRNDSEGEESPGRPASERKRARVINFSCPYRRRNPRMFNVRDFSTCAHHSFSSITLVKRHVMSAHQAKDFVFQCATCSTWFRTKKALDSHSNNRTCYSMPLLVVDQHDRGITEEMANILRDRRGDIKVLDWEALWRTIFPSSQGIVAPDYVPIIEHDEGREQFYRGLSELDPNTTLKVRRVLSKAHVIHPAQVVREVDHMVKMLSPPVQRGLSLESEAILNEPLATLSWEPTSRVLCEMSKEMTADQAFE
ncbi:hypothetical protein CEP54_001984 [Fusarium duplospermum]|uniref:C2H2-type domain-containing protein n=1 Tax=Fusarium duplospermum TaxID=1325734 RepID=A0A428QXI8_9HYPO|nr:hypothetical protein CEP54_001984 [Fusarium duplospermum]